MNTKLRLPNLSSLGETRLEVLSPLNGKQNKIAYGPIGASASQDADSQSTRKHYARLGIKALYASVTVLEFVRGFIHTFLYKNGLNDVSGLATGDPLCDGRLSALMVGYGGANLESFLVHSYILYSYVRYRNGVGFLRMSALAALMWEPVVRIVSSVGSIDVGDAEVPGRYAMLVRAIVSLVTLALTFV